MSAPRIESRIATDSEEFRARAEHNRALAAKLRADVAEAAKGGPEKHRERHVSRGKLLTIKNYYEMMVGYLTLVQIEGMRLLLTPFPQEEFNQIEDCKVEDQSLGISCLDCHSNFHSNAAFHLTPDVRPQATRFRLVVSSRNRVACGRTSGVR